MRHILTLVLIFTVTLGYSQNSGYPINTRNIVVGYQTTPEGIFYRGDTVPTFTPEKRYGTFMYVDTVRGNTYMYYNSVNKWKNIGSDSLLYNSSAQLLALKNGNEIALTVRTDTTLTGYNTLAQPLGVDTNVIATKYDISDLSPDKLYYPEVINKTGVLIKKGTLVMVDTLQLVQGDHVRIIPAVNNGRILSEYVMGVANQDISSDALGRVSWFGYVFEVKHSDIAQTGITLVAGDILYSSTTESGKFTNVPPTAPAHQSKIALLVRKPNDNNITLLVRPWLSPKLDNISNVYITNPAPGSKLVYNGSIWVDSTDVGNNWESYDFNVSLDSVYLKSMASDNSKILYLYTRNAGFDFSYLFTSTNKFTFETTNKFNTTINKIVYGNGVYVIVGDSNVVYRSTDGYNWTFITVPGLNPTDYKWTDLVYSNGLFIASSYSNNGAKAKFISSPDGVTWTVSSTAPNTIWKYLIYHKGYHYAKIGTNATYKSTDLNTWTLSDGNGFISAIVQNDSLFFIQENGLIKIYTPTGSAFVTTVLLNNNTFETKFIRRGNGQLGVITSTSNNGIVHDAYWYENGLWNKDYIRTYGYYITDYLSIANYNIVSYTGNSISYKLTSNVLLDTSLNTGTLNYIPKFTANTSLTNSTLYYSKANVNDNNTTLLKGPSKISFGENTIGQFYDTITTLLKPYYTVIGTENNMISGERDVVLGMRNTVNGRRWNYILGNNNSIVGGSGKTAYNVMLNGYGVIGDTSATPVYEATYNFTSGYNNKIISNERNTHYNVLLGSNLTTRYSHTYLLGYSYTATENSEVTLTSPYVIKFINDGNNTLRFEKNASYIKNKLFLTDTAFVKIPVGNTSQRTSGVSGALRFNTDNTNLEFHNGTTWSGLQNTIALTTSGTNGAATFNGTALNVPSYKGNFMTIGNIGSSNYLSSSLSALQLGTGSGGSIQDGDLYINVNSNEQFGAKYTFMVNGTPSVAAINSYFTFKNQYSFGYTANNQSFSIIKYGFGSHLGSGAGYSNVWYSDVYHTTPPYDHYNVHTNENVSAIRIDGENYTKALYINNQTTTNHSLYVDGGLTRLTKTGILQNTPLYSLDINATDAIRIPTGTTAQRPAALNNGIVRYNTDNLNLEYYSNSNWRNVINGTGYYDHGYRKSYLALFTGTATGNSNSVTYDNISSAKSAFNNSGFLDVNYTDTAGVRIYPNNWASGKRAYLTIGETIIEHVWGSQPNLSNATGFRFNLTNPTGSDQRFNIYSNDTSRFNLKLSNGYIGLLGVINPTSPIHIQVRDADEIYDYIRFQNVGTAQAYIKFEPGSLNDSSSRIGKTAIGSTGIMSASGNYQGIFYYPVTNRASINVNVPTRTLDVNGEVRVRDLTTTTPTKIVGSDVDGVLSDITVGSGLTLSSGTLSASGVTSTTGFSDGTSNAITITLEAASKPNHVFRYNNSGTISVSSVTINNAVIGGVYTIHFQDCIGAANQVTVTWPTTFKDLSGSNYGTRYYNSPTLVTCYYDGTNFNCN